MSVTNDVTRFLSERLPTLCWPVLNEPDDIDWHSDEHLPLEWTGAVVYIVHRWRKTTREVEFVASLDSIHATPKSARERVTELEAGLYDALIHIVPLHETGHDVDPYNQNDMVSPSGVIEHRYIGGTDRE